MQRILYITDSLVIGGIEAQLVELVTRLNRQRFEPHVACLYGPTARPLAFASALEAAGVPVHLFDERLTPKAKVRVLSKIIALERDLRPVLVQAENYHANLLARLAQPFFSSARLIGTVRGVLSPKQLFYERMTHPACEWIVTNAPHLVPMLTQQAHIPEHKIIGIPNGIDGQRFQAMPPTKLPISGMLPGTRRVFLVMGRISAEKNIHLTVQAFGLLKRQGRLPPATYLVIVGPVQEAAAQAQIEAAIREDDLAGIVVQQPETLQPELWYAACDVVIVFSSPGKPPAEGLPGVMLEALAAARPVIASDVANASGVITQGREGWIVKSRDVHMLADVVASAATLPDDALAWMRDACRERAQDFSVEKMVTAYERLYESALDR